MNTTKIQFDINNLLSVGVAVAVLILLFEIRGLLVILLASLVIATFAESFITLGNKLRFPRVLSVILFYLIIFILFGGVILFMVPVLITELGSLQELYPEIGSYVENLKLLQGVAQQNVPISELFASRDSSSLTQQVFNNISGLVGGLLNFIILFVVSFYLSVQEGGIERFIRIIIPIQHEEYAIDVWRRTKRKIGAWFNGQLLLALVVGFLTYLGLLILGTPYALLLGLLAMIFGMIPYGIILATLPAVAIAFIHGGWKTALIVMVMYWIIQQITDYVLQPLILKRLTGLPTLVVILSVIIAANLAGIIGVIIAIPVAVFILEMVNDREQSKKAILDEMERMEQSKRSSLLEQDKMNNED